MLCVKVCLQAMTSLYNRTTYIVMSLQFKDILDINLLIIITKTELGVSLCLFQTKAEIIMYV